MACDTSLEPICFLDGPGDSGVCLHGWISGACIFSWDQLELVSFFASLRFRTIPTRL